MPRAHDVAIYSPWSSQHFEAAGDGSAGGGGAELQMALLGEQLAANGIRVALITYPLRTERRAGQGGPDLIERPRYAGDRRLTGRLAESSHIWRPMSAADAEAYIFRGSGAQLLMGAVFCRLHRRRLIFSAANDLDFDFARPDRNRFQLAAYRAALRRADLVIVQREEQLELAQKAGVGPLALIPSFAEPAEASRAAPEGFLWIGRLVEYKRPLEYVRLAESLPDIPFRMVQSASRVTPAAVMRELEAAEERLPNLELLDGLPRAEMLDRIGRAAAVVLTSEAEGMPNVFLEAWARGVPVISLDYDPDGKIEGLGLGVVAAGSAERLREAARSLWEDAGRRAELGERGRDYVRAEHSPEAVGELWTERICEILGGRPELAGSQRG